MRAKYDSEDSSAFKCCFCCHVRVGTIILGLWHLLVHILVIGCLITSSIHPEILRDGMEPGNTIEQDVILKDENDGSSEGTIVYHYEATTNRKLKRVDVCIGFALVLCTFLISLMLVYGSLRSRPGYLIPFFCLQVFDFCLSCLTMVGYLSYAPNIKLWLRTQGMDKFPGMDKVMSMDEQWLMLLCVIVFVLLLSVKAYLINMVWSCYKYLQLRNANRSVVREYRVDPDSEMLLPPKYEEALKMKPAGPPPPPYTA